MAHILRNSLAKLNSFICHNYRQSLLGSKTFASHRRSTEVAFTKNEDRPVKKRKRRPFPLFVNSSLPLAPKLDKRPKQIFDYFLVLDFEATCDSPVNLDPQVIF